jgi:hypothetical protein
VSLITFTLLLITTNHSQETSVIPNWNSIPIKKNFSFFPPLHSLPIAVLHSVCLNLTLLSISYQGMMQHLPVFHFSEGT